MLTRNRLISFEITFKLLDSYTSLSETDKYKILRRHFERRRAHSTLHYRIEACRRLTGSRCGGGGGSGGVGDGGGGSSASANIGRELRHIADAFESLTAVSAQLAAVAAQERAARYAQYSVLRLPLDYDDNENDEDDAGGGGGSSSSIDGEARRVSEAFVAFIERNHSVLRVNEESNARVGFSATIVGLHEHSTHCRLHITRSPHHLDVPVSVV